MSSPHRGACETILLIMMPVRRSPLELFHGSVSLFISRTLAGGRATLRRPSSLRCLGAPFPLKGSGSSGHQAAQPMLQTAALPFVLHPHPYKGVMSSLYIFLSGVSACRTRSGVFFSGHHPLIDAFGAASERARKRRVSEHASCRRRRRWLAKVLLEVLAEVSLWKSLVARPFWFVSASLCTRTSVQCGAGPARHPSRLVKECACRQRGRQVSLPPSCSYVCCFSLP